MKKQGNKINPALPPVNKKLQEKVKAASSELITDMMWKSLLRVGAYIQLLEVEAAFFNEINVPEVRGMINEQLMSAKRYRLRLATIFSNDDNEVVQVLTDDMQEETVYDIGELIGFLKSIEQRRVPIFMKFFKAIQTLRTDRAANTEVFENIQKIIEDFLVESNS